MNGTRRHNDHLCPSDVNVMRIIERQKATSPQAIRAFINIHPKTLNLSLHRLWQVNLICKPTRGLVVDRHAVENDRHFRKQLEDSFGFVIPLTKPTKRYRKVSNLVASYRK